jgi:hypothetical protein
MVAKTVMVYSRGCREFKIAYNDPKYAPVIKQMKKQLLNLRKEVGDTDEKYPEMQELLEKYYNKDMR